MLTHDPLCPVHYGSSVPCNQWCLPKRVRARNAARDMENYFLSNDRKLYEHRLHERLLQHEELAHA